MAIERGKLNLYFETERFVHRTLTVDDSSGRWAGWLNDPVAVRMLNAKPRSFTQDELRDYIGTFDQTTRLLMGTFERQSGRHIAMWTGDIVAAGRKVIVSILIGEPEYRNLGMAGEIGEAIREHFFETLDFEAVVAQVLSYNAVAIAALEHRGWTLVQTHRGGKISARTGEPIDVLVYELSREAWRQRMRQQAAAPAASLSA